MRATAVFAVAAIFALAATVPVSGAEKVSIETLEGTVASVGQEVGESGLTLVAVDLATGDGTRLRVLLAPAETLAEIGFEVADGDRLRVRLSRDEDGTARAQKLMNVTRSSMVRLRTLRDVPLWTSSGRWQGGPCRFGPGAGRGHRGRGGPGGR